MEGFNNSQYYFRDNTVLNDQPAMTLDEWCQSVGLEIHPPEVGVHRSKPRTSYLDARGDELFQDYSTISPAHRQGEWPYSYSAHYQSTAYQQPDGGSNNIFEQVLYQPPTNPADPQPTNTPTQQQQQQQKQAGPKHTHFQNPSKVRKPRLRSGRSVPPPLSDARWNIWTLGNLNIRHINGGVTVKHLQQVLFNIDGNKRTKYDYHGLMGLIVDRRTASMGSAPEGWNAEQGWWVHFNV